ncbi:MAG: ParB N-terminal domain-containing protein [Oscillospiraceae bacterium]|nr:ParB N-terminal domain-containing protein [Oscillospiraceae bacterium]
MSEPAIRLVWKKIDELIPYEHNAKLHPQEQIDKLVGSFDEFGRIVPAGIDRDGNLIYGHGRILAARQRGDTDFPCIEIEGLSETQRRAFVHADNLLSQSGTDEAVLREEMAALHAAGFDVTLAGYDPAGLKLGEDEEPFWGDVDAESTEEYEAFVEKFKHKLTTDDVYTPDNIWTAVRDFAVKHYELGSAPIVRPFYPGGDYQAFEYPKNCVVIDNPPFSILSQICAWYDEHGVRYFLFAPGLTLFSINAGRSNYLPVGLSIMYSNWATIATSFATNLGAWKIELCPELYEALDKANDENLREQHKDLPIYSYPDCVASVSINRLCKYGQVLRIAENEASFTRALDAQRESGKAIYGGGFLLSEKAAAEKAAVEKAAAEKAAAEKAAALKWQLSEREKEIVASLGAEGSE